MYGLMARPLTAAGHEYEGLQIMGSSFIVPHRLYFLR
jgi:hypothetical protein